LFTVYLPATTLILLDFNDSCHIFALEYNDQYKMVMNTIRSSLSMNQEDYAKLRARVQRDMSAMNLLGERINTIRTKSLLRDAFSRVYAEFDHVFKEIPSEERTKCLTMLAQRCNYNHRRRRNRTGDHQRPKHEKSRLDDTHGSARSTANSSPDSEPLLEYSPKAVSLLEYPPKPVSKTMIQISTASGKTTSCRPDDIAVAGNGRVISSVDDVDFTRFSILITKDLSYNPEREILIYEREGAKDMPITNAQQWKTALTEMWYENAVRFSFVIKGKL
jgi:hypothetical protein